MAIIKESIRNQITFSQIPFGEGLKKGVQLTPEELIKVVRDSNIRGRGGAGFPTGMKWSFTAAAKGDKKYVVCNADEGEPGTFKDRVIFSNWAKLVFEGMALAGYAIGADEGIIYLRGEYTFLRKELEKQLEEERAAGLLGQNVAGKEGFSFDIHVHMGSGAYVCGEETALLEALEGHRGEARNRPPFPATCGYLGKPTVVNNVETFAWIASILVKGADWFKGLGTEKSAGLKLFSVSGDVERPGVYEFPFGITVEQLLKEVGGEGAKAVQIGGASGHCVPASNFNRAIAYEDVATGGSIMVIGPQRSMLDVLENFMEFFADESCGQCVPCRIGNSKLLEGVRMLQEGECTSKYLNELCKLAETMQIASKCGLGQSSPTAFLDIVKYFRRELFSGQAF
ncbi:MAG: SLBB domain-containing protein [Deltaproteobacteria bacterium]|nr:SLBB domain-containing protein [Deltaproteobacteria bacterium]